MKVHILFEFNNKPWGGGNQFLSTLRKYLVKSGVYAENFKDAQAIIFNSHHKLKEVLALKYNCPDKIFIHRIDGPLNVVRGGKNRHNDLTIKLFADKISDGIIFQSDWSRQQCHNLGIRVLYEDVIINAPDKELFNNQNKKDLLENRKIRIVTTSWSTNKNKGYDVFKYLDNNLDFSKFEMFFVGNIPLKFKNIKILGVVEHGAIADVLKGSDIFFFPSRLEACSNSLLEALHCGLVVAAYDGSSNRQLVGACGEFFLTDEGALKSINKVAESYFSYSNKFNLPGIEEISKQYYNFAYSIYKDTEAKKYTPKIVGKGNLVIMKFVIFFCKLWEKLLWYLK